MLTLLVQRFKEWRATRWCKGFDKLEPSMQLAFCMEVVARYVEAHQEAHGGPPTAVYYYKGKALKVSLDPLELNLDRIREVMQDKGAVLEQVQFLPTTAGDDEDYH